MQSISRLTAQKMMLPALIFMAMSAAQPAMATLSVETGFSPEGGALQQVLRTIDTAKSSIRLMGYSFTSPEVVKALVAAKRRGVDVRVVLDKKGNRRKASLAAMNVVASAGIPLRTNGHYAIMHDKVIIQDDRTIETGSFNFSRAADRSNSENVVVIHDAPELAHTYLQHWQSRWDTGTDWQPTY